MTAHSYHPDIHEHGLAADCDRCEEHAQDPLNALDGEVLNELVERTVKRLGYRSEAERVAMINIKRALDQACVLATANQPAFVEYAKAWGLQIELRQLKLA